MAATAVRLESRPTSISLDPSCFRNPGKCRNRLNAMPWTRLAAKHSRNGRVKRRSEAMEERF
jgi:hypothetical protein